MNNLLQYEFKSVLVWSKDKPFFKSHSLLNRILPQESLIFSFSTTLAWGFAISVGQMAPAPF